MVFQGAAAMLAVVGIVSGFGVALGVWLWSRRTLSEAEFQISTLFDANPAIAYELAPDGSLLRLNRAGCDLLGYAWDEIEGESARVLVSPGNMAEARHIFDAGKRGSVENFEIDLRTRSGEIKTVRGVGVPTKKKSRSGMIGVAVDMSDVARANRALEIQRHYFEELFEWLPEAIAIVDEAGVVRRVNEEFTRMFGYSKSEVEGRILINMIAAEEDREPAKHMSAMAAKGHVIREDVVRRRKDGSAVDVSMLARRVQVPGEELHVYAIYRDVGELVRTERRLRQREEELRHAQRLEAVGKLAGGVAHDFNNLLTIINGQAASLLEDLSPSDTSNESVQSIAEAGQRAASLTQQLLAFSRRQVLQPRRLDLNSIVEETQQMMARLLGTDVQVTTELATQVPRIFADRGQIEQVLVNLLVNARDAMADGGTVTIRTKGERIEGGDPRIEEWDLQPGLYARLEVEDTGVGMPPAVLKRAFEPFFTTKDRLKGTGLGLSTVFGVVKQTAGHVTAESQPESGARFTVFLPAAPPGSEPEKPRSYTQPRHERASQASATILLAEDEDAVRALVTRTLEKCGYKVLSAPNGAAAFEIFETERDSVDLVVSDLIMPDVGGMELASRVREIRPDTPVLLMSGYDDGLAEGRLGGEQFLAKPFTPSTLRERVSAILRELP